MNAAARWCTVPVTSISPPVSCINKQAAGCGCKAPTPSSSAIIMQTQARMLRSPQMPPKGLVALPVRTNWGVIAPSLRGVGCSAGKGFGAKPASNRPSELDDGPSSKKARSKRVRRDVPLPMMSQEEKDKLTGFQTAVELPPSVAEQEEAADFAKRLQALKQQGEEKKKELSPGPGGSLGPAGTANTAAFDAAPESIYANPPSLQDTLMSQLNSDVSDPKMKNAQFGPSQIGVAAGAIVFGLVFVLVAGGDFAPNNRFKNVRAARDPPDSVEQGIIKTRIGTLEQDLKLNPKSPETVQALALSYAQLLQYDTAANLLDKLTALQPNSADAWRLLGETSLLGEQAGRAVKAYEKAITLRNNDIQIATGMVDAYIANGQQSKAVDYLKELRPRSGYVSALGVVAKDAPAAATTDATTSDAAQPAASTATDAAASSSDASGFRPDNVPIKPLEPVSVELLLAKTFSSWRGHDSDALTTYDALIERFPEDFRGYLAKGVFLRDKGRRADAERMFLQARFYAPENRQRFVKETADTKPVVDLPDY